VRVTEKDEHPVLLRRLESIPPRALDGALVLLLIAPTAALYRHGLPRGTTVRTASVIAATLLSTLPLLVRRRWPVQVLIVSLAAAVTIPTAAAFSPPALAAVYAIASRRPWRMGVAGALVAALALDLHRLLGGYTLQLDAAIAGLALSGAAVALGLYRAGRLAYFEQTRERAARLERERELLDQQAATHERMRIARELHDVVAHNVSLIVIQAQALGQTADHPAARGTAHTIAELGRNAMSEMHRTLELMRADSPQEERSPQPALDDLGPLLASAQSAGINVELSVRGARRQLPAGIELSAYRIVQEALTNVIKHSGSDRALVVLRYGETWLELEILDHGRGAGKQEPPHSGHGLFGMRERVALFGGRLEAGPLNGHGYRVLATLPYEP
jgi:signal transduction histidine kinase